MLLLHRVWIFVCSLLIGSFQWAGFYLFHKKSRTLSQRFKKYLRYIHPNCPIFKLRTCLQAVVEYGNYKHSPHERLIGRIFHSRYISHLPDTNYGILCFIQLYTPEQNYIFKSMNRLPL